jgi:hypothetical protein
MEEAGTLALWVVAMSTDHIAAFHQWLFDATKHEPLTVRQIMEDIGTMRRNDCNCDGLPANGIECQEWLVKLEAHGRAARVGSYWKWAPGKPVALKAEQGSLFG